jgi:SAM-dependent methyltransferase
MFAPLDGGMHSMKALIKQVSILNTLAKQIHSKIGLGGTPPIPFSASHEYWERRYDAGGNSGVGSYGKFAGFKAEVINAFVASHGVTSVIEFGCGDGNQLALADYPDYLGLDVSDKVVSLCRRKFSADMCKRFMLTKDYTGETADLSLSLDVIYHLVEDDVFECYMKMLFNAADRYVIVYSSDREDNAGSEAAHVRHRKFTRWISQEMPGWTLLSQIPNRYPYKGDYREGSFADFFILQKKMAWMA